MATLGPPAGHRSRRVAACTPEYRTRLIANAVTGKLYVRAAEADLPDMDPLACKDGADIIQAESNSQTAERDIAKARKP